MRGQRIPPSVSPGDVAWPFWPAVPLYPYGKRQTLRREIVSETIWSFEQLQGIFYVVVPIRMTVVRLAAGGLLVYAPVAPTRECVRLMRELEAAHGEVRYIILPTTSGVEHKVFVGPFARRFPRAQVLVAPDQWSFPLDLPLSWLGLPGKRTQLLPQASSQAPFADEFDCALLGPIPLGIGPFEEVALFHRPSRTLLLTDTVLSVPSEPPAVVQLDPDPLMFHARDDAFDAVAEGPESRRKGWQRIVLFALYFRPSPAEVVPLGQALSQALRAPDRSKKAYFGILPWRWNETWQQSFRALQRGGAPLVAPILQTLVLNRAPAETIAWADRVASWPFERIVPCHFQAPIEATPSQFRQAFGFLEHEPAFGADPTGTESQPLPEADLAVLQSLEASLMRRGLLPPRREKV